MYSILLPADLYAKFFVAAESRTSAPPVQPPDVAPAVPVSETRAPTPSGGLSRAAGTVRTIRRSPGLLPLARLDLEL